MPRKPTSIALGSRFGRLTVGGMSSIRYSSGAAQFECACDCGNAVLAIGSALLKGTKVSCGCLYRENVTKANGKLIPSGARFERLTVVSQVQKANRRSGFRYLCRCDCGKELEVDGKMLRCGNTKSCGCFSIDSATSRFTLHGKSRTKAYKASREMKRYALKVSACPKWANDAAIDAIYKRASALRKEGFDVQVDHVIPLRSEVVCGLHVENNLRIISAFENQSKGNKFDPMGDAK